MAAGTHPPPDGADSELMNYVVRMVTPLRREFGCTLDVPHFLHDFTYAREILAQARTSQDGRLREYAAYVESKLFGPRNSPAPAASAAVVAAPAAAAVEPPATPEEMRARMLSKYRSSLR